MSPYPAQPILVMSTTLSYNNNLQALIKFVLLGHSGKDTKETLLQSARDELNEYLQQHPGTFSLLDLSLARDDLLKHFLTKTSGEMEEQSAMKTVILDIVNIFSSSTKITLGHPHCFCFLILQNLFNIPLLNYLNYHTHTHTHTQIQHFSHSKHAVGDFHAKQKMLQKIKSKQEGFKIHEPPSPSSEGTIEFSLKRYICCLRFTHQLSWWMWMQLANR